MGVLQSMHSSRVGSVFGKDLDEVEGKIEKLTRDITDRFRTAERYLQRVGTATRRAGGEEAVVGSNVQRRSVSVCLLLHVIQVSIAICRISMYKFCSCLTLLLYSIVISSAQQFGQKVARTIGGI